MVQQHFVWALANEQVRQIGSHVVEQGNFMDQCFRLASLSTPHTAITSERFGMAPAKPHIACHRNNKKLYSRLHESF